MFYTHVVIKDLVLFWSLLYVRGIKTMSEQFEKINSKDLLYVITSRGAIDAKKGCAIL